MKPLKVALFTDADVFAGTERHLIDLARGLKSRGVAVSVACPGASPTASIAGKEGVPVIAIEKKGTVDHAAIGTLCRKFRGGELDIVHAHNGRTSLLAAIARSLGGRGGLVATQHFLAPAHLSRSGVAGLLSLKAHRWVNGRFDHVIAISQAACRGLAERGELAPDKMTVVHNGIPIPNEDKLESPEAVRAHLGVSGARPLIVCAARLEPEKSIQTLVNAMPDILEALPQAVCVIAGAGSQRERLQMEIKRLKLAGRVILPGFIPDILSLIGAGDVFVLPSLAEPFGLVLLEAMALGKPVVATGAGGPLEIVENGVSGLLIAPADSEALAKAICKIGADSQLAQRMGRRGQMRFHQEFTADQMIDAVLAIYRRVQAAEAS